MLKAFRLAVLVATGIGLTLISTANQAAQFFSEDFNAATFNSGLESSGGVAWNSGVAGNGGFSGENVIQRASGGADSSRNYIRTTDSDYNTVDFRMRVSYSVFGTGSDLVFLGLGDGTQTAAASFEPGDGIFLRNHANNSADGVGARDLNNGFVFYHQGFTVGSGTHRLEVEKIGDIVTFSIDQNFNGTFATDFTWASFDLGLASMSYMDSTNSRLFFGTGNANSQFDDFEISGLGLVSSDSNSVPLPGIMGLMLIGIMGHKFRFYRQR